MHLSDYDTSNRHHATLVSSERITAESIDEVRELVFDVDGPLEVEVGQSVGVLVPGDVDFGPKEHFRLYSIADIPEVNGDGKPRIKLCVKRVSYVDEYNGERYDGRASHYLCDLKQGDEITVTGPYGVAFELPDSKHANLVLIGMGTGIAPFRAFIKKLYAEMSDFEGSVWLFHGAKSGLEMLYMNEEKNDFAQYYDKDTFKAFEALSPRPHWEDPIAWDNAIAERGHELWNMMGDPQTYVYIAGQSGLEGKLDKVFTEIVGDRDKFERRKAELKAGRRWVELYY